MESRAHVALAREAAGKAVVLLKNDGVLPLKPTTRIAVVGPLADSERVLVGSYSSGLSTRLVTLLDGIRAAFARSAVNYAPARPLYGDLDTIPEYALRDEQGKLGLTARYYAMRPDSARLPNPTNFGALLTKSASITFETMPSHTGRDPYINVLHSLGLKPVSEQERVIWSGSLVAPDSGTYRLGLKGVDGQPRFQGKPLVAISGMSINSDHAATVTLEEGRSYPIEVQSRFVGGGNAIHLGWRRIATDPIAESVATARDADVIVAVVGITSDLESEENAANKQPGFDGGDRITLDLPTEQQALIESLKATGKKLIVVNMSGSAMGLGWADQNANAVVQAWYPGGEGGAAVADILIGKINPSGRLPVTFYRDVAQLPPFTDNAMKGRTYRYFKGNPLYAFGHGLS